MNVIWDCSKGEAPPTPPRRLSNVPKQIAAVSSAVPLDEPVPRTSLEKPNLSNNGTDAAIPNGPPSPFPFHTPASHPQLETGNEEYNTCRAFFDSIFYCATFFVILCAIALMAAAGRINYLADLYDFYDQIHSTTNVMYFGAVFIGIIAIVGYAALLFRSKTTALIYAALLAALLIGQLAASYRITERLNGRIGSLTNSWDRLTDYERNQIQRRGNCCGYYDSLDRPGSYCPLTADTSCSQRIRQLELSTRNAIIDVFWASLIFGVLMCAFLLVLIFSY